MDVATPDEKYRTLLAEIEREFPRFRIIPKHESLMQRVIHHGLRLLTLGAMDRYLAGYHTTMGQRVYVAASWDNLSPESKYQVLRHERVHIRQFRKYTFLGMGFLYLFVPCPFGFAFFRAKFEKEGYAESIRAAAEVHGIEHVASTSFRDNVIQQFTSSAYGWMWPFPKRLGDWYDGVLKELEEKCPHP